MWALACCGRVEVECGEENTIMREGEREDVRLYVARDEVGKALHACSAGPSLSVSGGYCTSQSTPTNPHAHTMSTRGYTADTKAPTRVPQAMLLEPQLELVLQPKVGTIFTYRAFVWVAR